MPFVNSAQRRACMYKEQDDIRNGHPVKWDCKKFAKVRYAGRLRQVYLTARGAKYINVNGRKVYVYGVY
jgi:hypothetical protein